MVYASELGPDKPRSTRLLNRDLVLWRAEDGKALAMDDRCIHRGTALSLGWIDSGCLVCPYHGWQYASSGQCRHIPQLAEQKLPAKAKVDSFRTLERYGLIWVCLSDEPKYELPEIQELEDESYRVVNTGPFTWQCNASRQVENFTDFGHFPWVHPGLLGDKSRPLVPEHEVEIRNHVLHYRITRPEAPNSDEFPVFANENQTTPERVSQYELHLPFTILLRLGWGGEKGMVYLFASQPLGEDACRGYCIIARNYDLEQPDEVLQDFEQTIFEQDRRIVESQKPHRVPLELTEELHMRFDAVAIAYRRAMSEQGFNEGGVSL